MLLQKKVILIISLLNVSIDGFSLAVLLVIYLNMRRHSDPILFDNKLFRLFLTTETIIIALDISMFLLDGKPGFLTREVYLIVTAGYYILNPVICMLWYLYADFHIYRSMQHIKKVLIPILIPSLLSMTLSVLSIFNGFSFYLDDANVYHRGNGFPVMAVIAFFYLIYTTILIIVKQKQIQKQYFTPILVFPIPPIIGGILQTIFFGYTFLWPAVTLSILIIFINIQNEQLHRDYLTGLSNRRQLDNYMQSPSQMSEGSLIAGIMIDLNSFKMINDEYGHSAGDQALQHTAELLKQTFRKNDFIARYGGDEFIVLAAIQEQADLHRAISRLKENVDAFNAHKIVPYSISFSIGYDCYTSQSKISVQDFIRHLDVLMYEDKRNNSAKREAHPE